MPCPCPNCGGDLSQTYGVYLATGDRGHVDSWPRFVFDDLWTSPAFLESSAWPPDSFCGYCGTCFGNGYQTF